MITRQTTEGFRRSIRVDGRQPQVGRGTAVRGVVPEGMVRMAPVMALPSLLHEFRVDPTPLLAGFGVEPGDPDEPEHLISFEGRSQLLARCAEAARCPHLGLLLGQRAGMSTFGPVGFLMQSEPDMRSALALGMKYFRLHNPNSAVRIDILSLEFYRLQGDLLLALSCDNQFEAERIYLRAIELARAKGVPMVELRAAISLCRLWRDQGKVEEGRRLLNSVYENFTEGFTTADLLEARELLK